MTASKRTTRRIYSDLAKVDAHVIQPHEYEEIPELIDEDYSRGVLKRAGRPKSANPRQLLTLRLPPDVIARWKATGPGWQTRMAVSLSKYAPRVSGRAVKKKRTTAVRRVAAG